MLLSPSPQTRIAKLPLRRMITVTTLGLPRGASTVHNDLSDYPQYKGVYSGLSRIMIHARKFAGVKGCLIVADMMERKIGRRPFEVQGTTLPRGLMKDRELPIPNRQSEQNTSSMLCSRRLEMTGKSHRPRFLAMVWWKSTHPNMPWRRMGQAILFRLGLCEATREDEQRAVSEAYLEGWWGNFKKHTSS